jgi:MoxR-like ATPase
VKIKHGQRTAKCNKCGERHGYWWHDLDSDRKGNPCIGGSESCKVHDMEGKATSWLYLDEYGNDPVCPTVAPAPVTTYPPAPIRDEYAYPYTAPEVPETPKQSDSDLEALSGLLRKLAGSSVDDKQVREIVRQELTDFVTPTVVTIEHRAGEPLPDTSQLGMTHSALPEVLRALQAGLNVWCAGPAGSGKTTLARQVAKAMELDFAYIGLSNQTPRSELFGFKDMVGNYHATDFRRIAENGGVFLFDEVDAGNSNTLTSINGVVASEPGDLISFPDGMIALHKDAHFIAGANTYGRGADRIYVGRNQIDAATLNRFVFVAINYDWTMTEAIANAHYPENSYRVSKLAGYVRDLQESADTHKLPIVIGPRAVIHGARLLNAGASMDDVVTGCVRQGISDKDWDTISYGVVAP